MNFRIYLLKRAEFFFLSNKRFPSEFHSIRANRLRSTQFGEFPNSSVAWWKRSLAAANDVCVILSKAFCRIKTIVPQWHRVAVEWQSHLGESTAFQWSDYFHLASDTIHLATSQWLCAFGSDSRALGNAIATRRRRWTTTSFGMSRKSKALASMRMTRSVEHWWHCLHQCNNLSQLPLGISEIREQTWQKTICGWQYIGD